MKYDHLSSYLRQGFALAAQVNALMVAELEKFLKNQCSDVNCNFWDRHMHRIIPNVVLLSYYTNKTFNLFLGIYHPQFLQTKSEIPSLCKDSCSLVIELWNYRSVIFSTEYSMWIMQWQFWASKCEKTGNHTLGVSEITAEF